MPGGPRPPLEVIFSWPAANFVNPESRGTVTTPIAAVLSPITFFIYFARLWVRFRLQRNAGIDDWLMVVALPLVAALAVLIPYSADKFHSGVHIWDVDVTLFTVQRKLILAIEILFVLATGLIKISILLFFRRLGSRGTSKTFRVITWVAIGFTISSTIAFFISPLVGCRPISGYWEQSDVTKIVLGEKFNCNEEGAAITAAGVVSTVQDLITALLPNFIYWKAQIPFRQKAALMGIFATAYGVAVFGAMRVYSTWVLFYETYDVSWQLWEIWNWTLLELHIGVICANAPALKVFVKRYLKIRTKSTPSSQAKSSQAKSSQAKSSQTASQARSDPSGKSKSKMALWKNSFANFGYFSQATHFSADDDDKEKGDGDTLNRHISEDTERQYREDDVEMGILKKAKNYLAPPPQAHRASGNSNGMMSLYYYDDNEETEEDTRRGGFRYMRVEV